MNFANSKNLELTGRQFESVKIQNCGLAVPCGDGEGAFAEMTTCNFYIDGISGGSWYDV